MTRRIALASLALVLGAVACRTPEATRMRGTGPGADPGNHAGVVEMHGGSQPYWKTPRLIGRVGLADLSPATQAQRLSREGK